MQYKKRFEEAEKLAHLGHWEWNFMTDSVVWSDEVFRIFGEVPQSFMPTFERFMSYLVPEDQLKMQESVSRAIESKTSYQFNYMIERKNGQIRYLKSLGQAKYDEEGKPISMLGTVLDITMQHKMEQKLKSLSDIIENSINEVYVFDPKSFYFIYVNDAAQKKTGYTFEEMKGMTPLDIKTRYTRQSF